MARPSDLARMNAASGTQPLRAMAQCPVLGPSDLGVWCGGGGRRVCIGACRSLAVRPGPPSSAWPLGQDLPQVFLKVLAPRWGAGELRLARVGGTCRPAGQGAQVSAPTLAGRPSEAQGCGGPRPAHLAARSRLPDLLLALLLALGAAAALRAGEAGPRVHALLHVPRHAFLQRQGGHLTRRASPRAPQDSREGAPTAAPRLCHPLAGGASPHLIYLLAPPLRGLRAPGLQNSSASAPRPQGPRAWCRGPRRSAAASAGTWGARPGPGWAPLPC